MIAANCEMDSLIRDGVQVEFKDEQGCNRKERVTIAAEQKALLQALTVRGSILPMLFVKARRYANAPP